MLFEFGTTVRGIRLIEFLAWAHESFNLQNDRAPPQHGLLALPPIQRDAAWNPKQALDLWDSVFHGLPLGTFILQERADGKLGRFLEDDARIVQMPAGWDLLDGQQRLRSLLLGRYGFNLNGGARDSRCIWIDLGNQGKEDFKLYLTSASQPFGYNPDGYKLSPNDRAHARLRYEPEGTVIKVNNRRAYTHELFMKFIERPSNFFLSRNDKRTPMMPPEGHPKCWPPLPRGVGRNRAEDVVNFSILPLHVLLGAWFNAGHQGRAQALTALIGDNHQDSVQRISGVLTQFEEAEIALINASRVVGADKLRRLYDRIGAGGTPLSTEDRLFSLYKSIRSDFHNLVLDIHGQVGSIMPSSKIAVSAIRIANALANRHYGIPDVASFARAVEEENNQLCHRLDEICPVGADVPRPFFQALTEVCCALRYEKNNPLGLPAAVMRHLPSQLIQTLAFWKLRNINNKFNENCNNVMRFSLAWLLASWNDDKISSFCLEMIEENKGNGTLQSLLKDILAQENLTRGIITPDRMHDILVTNGDNVHWRSLEDRINDLTPREADLVRVWWRDDRRFLPWLQRRYLGIAFPDYDPLADREDDTPYDIDHMVPRNDWGFNWGDRNARLCPLEPFDNAQLNKFRWVRNELGDSIGNKWLVNFSTNRAWNDTSFPEKLQWIRQQINGGHGDYAALLQGAFDCAAEETWNQASNGNVWTDPRLIALQNAVEMRAVWLYRRLYEELGLGNWLNAGQPNPGGN